MNSAVNDLARSVTGNASPEECALDSLQQLAAQNPSFGPVQVLLAGKLKTGDPALFEKQLQRTALHFTNPLWLDHLLNEDTTAFLPAGKVPVNVFQEPTVITLIETPATIEEVVVQVTEEKDIAFHGNNFYQEPSVTPEIETPATIEEVVVQVAEEDTNGEEEDNGEGSPPEESETQLEIRMPEFKIEPINPATAELVFEPYHTIDYFASLGIRAREEDKPKDTFSLQLKSFTEWLKIMKRLPVTEIAANTSASDERRVEQLAQHSITDHKVITEAMAEVWEKQGDKLKATEVYKKLSLLDPAKSSYFAAKIEQLKHL